MNDQLHHEGPEEPGENTINKLRRFSLGISSALLIYVLAGGEIPDEIKTQAVTVVHFKNPSVLLVFLVLVTAYASFRYWYHGIYRALTRRKVRAYLVKPESIFVFSGSERRFNSFMDREAETDIRACVHVLYRKLPSGMPRDHCVVIGHDGTEEHQIKEQAAKKAGHYFPGLTPENISIIPLGTQAWAHVSSISSSTRWTCWTEDVDLYLPVLVSGLALVAICFYALWPWALNAFRNIQ